MTEKSNLYLTTFLCLLVALISVNCKSSSSVENNSHSIDAIAKQKLGEQFSRSDNSDHTYTLVQQVRTQDHVQQTIKYIVIHLQDYSIAYEGSFKMGYVKWNSNETIEVFNGDLLDDSKSEKKIITILNNQR